MGPNPRFVFTTINEELTPVGGLSAVGAWIDHTLLRQRFDQLKLEGFVRPEISHGDVCVSFLGLLCQGKTDYDHIEAFRDDKFFRVSLGLKKVPSSATLRQRLDAAALNDDAHRIIQEEIVRLLIKAKPVFSPVTHWGHIPLDIDVSPFDNSGSHKEGVACTYKKVDGYAPLLAYLGKEGYAISGQLRPGNTHSQKEAPDFFRQAITAAKKVVGDRPLLVRTDSAHDCLENLGLFLTHNVDFIVKRNLRTLAPEHWLEMAKETQAAKEVPREGKQVWRGRMLSWLACDEKAGWKLATPTTPGARPVYQVYVVTERTIEAKGQVLLTPQVEADVWWTSLDLSVHEIEELYHQHGTSEQFHSELKTDLNLERLPSGKFKTNALILELGLLAFDILRLVGQQIAKSANVPLRKQAERRRLKTIIQNVITVAARLMRHGRRTMLGFRAGDRWYPPLREAYAAVFAC